MRPEDELPVALRLALGGSFDTANDVTGVETAERAQLAANDGETAMDQEDDPAERWAPFSLEGTKCLNPSSR